MHAARRCFTTTELMISSGLMVILLACAIPFMINSVRVNSAAAANSEIQIQKLAAQEQIKRDLQTSAPGLFVVSPNDGSTIRAISFPVLRRAIEDTSLPLDDAGLIVWSATITYHMYKQEGAEGYELRRTIFTPRNNSLPLADRQMQLDDVLRMGDGRGTIGGNTATTHTLLTHVADFLFQLDPTEVDAYAAQASRETLSLGTFVLEPGLHTFRLVMSGRNPQSSGYGLGLDDLVTGPAGSAMEGEFYCPPDSYTGPTPVATAMNTLANNWSNNAVMKFPASAAGQFVSLQLQNDCWMESNFTADGAATAGAGAEIAFDAALADVVVQQKGNDVVWRSTTQTASALPAGEHVDRQNSTVRVLIGGADAVLGGNILYSGRMGRVAFTGSVCGGSTAIDSAYIMERADGFNGIPATMRQLTFWNAYYTSGAYVFNGGYGIALSPGVQAFSDLVDLPVDRDKDYLVSFHIGDFPGWGYASFWKDSAGRVQTAVIAADYSGLAGQASWSGVPTTSIQALPQIITVSSVYATFPAESLYTSQAFDTRVDYPAYTDLEWRAAMPSATQSPLLRVRTGSSPDMSDASDWSVASAFASPGSASLSGLPPERYVQFQAVFRGIYPYTTTAKLRDVLIGWNGLEKSVEVSAAVERGPDKGKIRLEVDGTPCLGGTVIMNFHIVRTFLRDRFEESVAVESSPRNP